MKKRFVLVILVIFCCSFVFSASRAKVKNKKNKSEETVIVEQLDQVQETVEKQIPNNIAVPVPKTLNFAEGTDWIPVFIQGIITSNFQQYSGMNVIDRQNTDMVKAEQKLSENVEYSESDVVEFGKLINARLIIAGTIIEKSGSYALSFSITDIQTGETKSSAYIPTCLYSFLESGAAANQISYELMKNFGISLSTDVEKKLTNSAENEEMIAQSSLAKGIVAENKGTNIEALTYYIKASKSDKKLREATSRMQNMTTVVSSGNFGANAKNLIKLRKEWDNLLREAAELIASNPPEFAFYYNTDIHVKEMTEEDYENETMSFYVTSPALIPTDYTNRKIANDLLRSLRSIDESENWGEKLNGFPVTYFKEIKGDSWVNKLDSKKPDEYIFTMNLLDANKKTIATHKVTFHVSYKTDQDWYKTRYYVSYEGVPQRIGDEFYVNFNSVSVENADTDTLYITVDNNNSQEICIQPFKEMTYEGTCSQCGEFERYYLDKTSKTNFILTTAGGYYDWDDPYFSSDSSFSNANSIMFLGGLESYQPRWSRDNLKILILPSGINRIWLTDYETPLFPSLEIICFRGSKEEWEQINGKSVPSNIKIIFDYTGILGKEVENKRQEEIKKQEIHEYVKMNLPKMVSFQENNFEISESFVTQELYEYVSTGIKPRNEIWYAHVSIFRVFDFCNKLSIVCGYKPVYKFDGNDTFEENVLWETDRIDVFDDQNKVIDFVQRISLDESANGFRLPSAEEFCIAFGFKFKKKATSMGGMGDETNVFSLSKSGKNKLNLFPDDYEGIGDEEEFCFYNPYILRTRYHYNSGDIKLVGLEYPIMTHRCEDKMQGYGMTEYFRLARTITK